MYCNWGGGRCPNVGFRRTLQTSGGGYPSHPSHFNWINFLTKCCPTVRAVQICRHVARLRLRLHSRQLDNGMLWCIPMGLAVVDQLVLRLAQMLLVHLAGPGLLHQAA